MALSSSRLATAMEPVIEQKMRQYILNGDYDTPYPDMTKFTKSLAEAIAQEVVKEIKDNAALKNAHVSGTVSGTVTGATCSTVFNSGNNTISGGVE